MGNRTVCLKDTCAACGVCTNICSKNAISINDGIEASNAIINTDKCISCGLCEKMCPNVSLRELRTPIFWRQGWAKDEIRGKASSGGAASAIIKSFIESGGYVASCLFKNGTFGFDVINSLDKARKFAGSKYVKSNLGHVYKDIKDLLKNGQEVLFVGLPCQSAAIQNYCGSDFSENLYTADLICHGTPSPKLLKTFFEELGFDWDNISNIQFRDSEFYGLSNNGKRITPRRVIDSYLRAFLNCIDYTDNCYSCRYAKLERVSDITLGDAWGQMSETVPGGVSLILCQTQKGIELVKKAELHLEDVDLNKAVEANQQLRHPSVKHRGREVFYKELRKGHTFRWATIKAIPLDSIKQSIKMGLLKAGIIKDI